MGLRTVTITTLFVLLTAGLSLIGASFFDQLACEGQPINKTVKPTQAQQIWGERVIGQSFTSPRGGLNRIDIFFQTYQRQNTHDVNMRLLEILPKSRDSEQVEVFSTSFNGTSVSDQTWHSFTFPQISDSAGKTYLITLQSPESVDGNAITVGGIERNVYVPGSAFLGPVAVMADIAFRACYQLTVFEKLQVFSEQLSRNRPFLWNNIAFYWLWILAYGLLLTGFFWRLIKEVL